MLFAPKWRSKFVEKLLLLYLRWMPIQRFCNSIDVVHELKHNTNCICLKAALAAFLLYMPLDISEPHVFSNYSVIYLHYIYLCPRSTTWTAIYSVTHRLFRAKLPHVHHRTVAHKSKNSDCINAAAQSVGTDNNLNRQIMTEAML